MSEMKISPTDDCTWLNEDCTLMIDGETPKEAEIAAGKINSHDRMMEEIAELRKALSRISKWDELSINRKVDIGSNGERDYYREIASVVLTKLNQEGEE